MVQRMNQQADHGIAEQQSVTLPPNLNGDFALGLRTMPQSGDRPDYARGQETRAPIADGPDFARGQRSQPPVVVGPDYARGLHASEQ